jgi:N-acetylmuramoyl-L-alanine amidase
VIKRIIALALVLAGTVLPRALHAQTPSLHVEGTTGARDFAGTWSTTARFPVTVFDAIGGTVRSDRAGVVVLLFGDTLRFGAGSPFFTAGGTVYQLAHDNLSENGTLAIAEQLFVQWLPAHYPTRVEYRNGALRIRGDMAAATSTNPNATSSQPRPSSPDPRPSSSDPAPAPTTVGSSRGDAPPAPANRPAAGSGARSKRIVVIDPGHGGVDSGALGPNGLKEKDAVLMIGSRLAALLRTRGYEVHMTRTRDTLISLADRPRFANQWKGDEPGALYISIHNNSAVPAAHGFETYFLADASTDDERRVADMENAAVKYEKATRTPGSGLDQVLNGLRNDFYMKASNAFADVVQKGMAEFHPGPNRGVKRANFRVLIGALMPAVLVEVAFISNPREADLLGMSAFQDKLAYSLAEGVDKFFRDNEALWVKQ